jgi:replicative DNA helicase
MSIQREQGFITELLVSRDMSMVVDNCINSSYLNGKYKKAFKYIQQHQATYGDVPTIDTFLSKNPDFNLAKTDDSYGTGESLKYWCDQVREKKKHNMMADGMENLLQLMNEEMDTEGAYETIKRLVLKVENEVILADRAKINENTHTRKEDYLKRQKSGGMTGIPTFIDLVDKIMGGLNDGELITFMGYTGTGKSWLEIIMAVAQAKAGYRVLFFTTEMHHKMVMRRIDAVWNGFNYSLFKKGQLQAKDQKKYFDYLDEMEKTPDDEVMLIVEQATGGISQISAKIDQYNPDVVYIDGAYLLDDEEGEEDNWMGTVRIWRGLHKLCLAKKLPIVATTQSKDESGATIKSLSFSKALSNECDVLAVLEQDEQQRNDREADLRFLKLREGDTLSTVHMDWDFDKMKYNSLFKEKAVEQTDVKNVSGVITID